MAGGLDGLEHIPCKRTDDSANLLSFVHDDVVVHLGQEDTAGLGVEESYLVTLLEHGLAERRLLLGLAP